jgi:hypothetical protein
MLCQPVLPKRIMPVVLFSIRTGVEHLLFGKNVVYRADPTSSSAFQAANCRFYFLPQRFQCLLHAHHGDIQGNHPPTTLRVHREPHCVLEHRSNIVGFNPELQICFQNIIRKRMEVQLIVGFHVQLLVNALVNTR